MDRDRWPARVARPDRATRATRTDLAGRTAIVTGANTGLGLATTRALVVRGARVIMACRDQAKGEAARRGVLAATGAGPEAVAVWPLDLADQAAIAAFATRFGGTHDRLHLLVNNAGLGFVDQGRTADGFEQHLGVNHLGHMALTLRLLPVLRATPGARIVTVTSIGHRLGRIRLTDPNLTVGRYGRTRAYTQSKLANLLFARELARRLAAAGETTLSLAADPGLARSELGTKQNSGLMWLLSRFAFLLPAQSAAGGARPILRAATHPGAVTGELHAPRWFLWGPGVVRRPAARARDPRRASDLWDLSLRLLAQPELVDLPDRPSHPASGARAAHG